MKIAVIGAGAIGSVVAAYLTKAGQDITLIGRENQVKEICGNGLKIRGIRGEETLKVKALTCFEQEYDLVIFTVKTQDIKSAVSDNQEFNIAGLYVYVMRNSFLALECAIPKRLPA